MLVNPAASGVVIVKVHTPKSRTKNTRSFALGVRMLLQPWYAVPEKVTGSAQSNPRLGLGGYRLCWISPAGVTTPSGATCAAGNSALTTPTSNFRPTYPAVMGTAAPALLSHTRFPMKEMEQFRSGWMKACTELGASARAEPARTLAPTVTDTMRQIALSAAHVTGFMW